MSQIYIALGANLGEPAQAFLRALQLLGENGACVLKTSGLWQSPAWPTGQGHPDYINACAQIKYNSDALSLLQLLHRIESEHGRERGILNAPRTLDLDLLDYRGKIENTPSMTLPHPRMMNRSFVVFPLSQIAPGWRHPVTSESIERAISRLPLADVAPVNYLGRKDFATV